MLKKIRRYLKDPSFALGCDMIMKCPNLMSDKFHIKTRWRLEMGYELNLNNPKSFNEKIQWIKLNDHNPIYTLLVDKYRVKDYVAERIGAEHIIPTLAAYTSVDEIDLEKLPNQFVLKCNHDSGSVVLCRDKAKFDLEAAKKFLGKSLKENYYWGKREWAYKNVKPIIIAEQYMEDSKTHGLPDYKFFAFDGEVKSLFIATERFNGNSETRFDFFDMDFKHINVTNGHPNADVLPDKPHCFNQMVAFAKVLSKGFPQVRLDFYEVNNHVFFGEYTFYHFAGTVPFNPADYDLELGSYIKLPS